jgi:hypothetical protein
VLKFEDMVDYLHCLYPQFECYIIFYHSNGHDRLRPDDLNMNKTCKSLGGTQPLKRDTVVTQDNIGPHQDGTGQIKPNETQKCVFTESDEGPINLTPTQRIERKYDKLVVGNVEVQLTKDELIEHLKRQGIRNPSFGKKKFQQLCVCNGLPTKKNNSQK